jgi:hypothetical protein
MAEPFGSGRLTASLFIMRIGKGMAMARERRKRTRVPVGFEVTIALQDEKVKVKTVNISMTGVRCEPNGLFHVNEKCKVILCLNPDTTLKIEGKILRVADGEAIISFLSMDEDAFFHLKRLMQFNSPDPDKIEKELKKPAFV